MTAAPKAKPRKMWGVYHSSTGELVLGPYSYESVARATANRNLRQEQAFFVQAGIFTPIEEDA